MIDLMSPPTTQFGEENWFLDCIAAKRLQDKQYNIGSGDVAKVLCPKQIHLIYLKRYRSHYGTFPKDNINQWEGRYEHHLASKY